MTPELSKTLEAINYERVLILDPFRASTLYRTLTPSGVNIYKTSKEARGAERNANDLLDAAKELSDGLKNLRPLEKRELEYKTANYWPPDFDDVFPTIVRTLDAIHDLIPGLCGLKELAGAEGAAQPTGAPRTVAVEQIATALAEIYVVGMGKAVTCGVDSSQNEPSTLFMKTLKEVFNLVGVPDGSVRRAAETARDTFTKEDLKELLAIYAGSKPGPPFCTPMFR